jgi:hypothetical protein
MKTLKITFDRPHGAESEEVELAPGSTTSSSSSRWPSLPAGAETAPEKDLHAERLRVAQQYGLREAG